MLDYFLIWCHLGGFFKKAEGLSKVWFIVLFYLQIKVIQDVNFARKVLKTND